MTKIDLKSMNLATRVVSVLSLILSLTACVAPAWQQRDAARGFTTDWEKVDFTNERQTEILRSFGCSEIRTTNLKTFTESVEGKNCTVLGEKIPLMSTMKFTSSVAFAGFCPPFGTPADPNRADIGRQVQARLKERLGELSQQVFQGKAEGRLEAMSRGPTGKMTCSFDLRPVLH
jgi:hypothetical protein